MSISAIGFSAADNAMLDDMIMRMRSAIDTVADGQMRGMLHTALLMSTKSSIGTQ